MLLQIGGSFALIAGGVSTAQLPFNASAQAVQQAWSTLPTGAVSVTRTGPTPQGGYVWTVTYTATSGAIAAPTVNTTLMTGTGLTAIIAHANVGTVQEVQTIDFTAAAVTTAFTGNFSLTFNGAYSSVATTRYIAMVNNCSILSASVTSALNALTNVGNVSVGCSGTANTTITLAVTFLNNPGTFPVLAVNTSQMTGLAVSSPTVTKTTPGTSVNIGGNFALVVGGQRTGYIPISATPELVQARLEALSTVGDIAVTRSLSDIGQYSWTVMFISDLGPQPLMGIDYLATTGSASFCTVCGVVEL